MPRLFIGIKCAHQDYPKSIQLELKRLLPGSHINWVDPANFHITLKFLGDVDDYSINSIKLILESISQQFNPITLYAQKPGSFGTATQPRVIWFGYKEEPILSELQQIIDKELITLGLKTEEKKFTAHLTLGRVKRMVESDDFNTYIKNHKSAGVNKFQMNAFQLFQSTLYNDGPIYTVLQEFRLDKRESRV